MQSADGTPNEWVRRCATCRDAWSDDGRVGVHDENLPWSKQLVPVDPLP